MSRKQLALLEPTLVRQALLDAGAKDVQYQEYPDIGHWIWLNAWDEPGLLDWLFSVSK